VTIVMDSLKKTLGQIPDPNPEKGHFLHLDHARPNVVDHEIQAKSFRRVVSSSLQPRFGAGQLLAFWPSDNHAGKEFI
jgi:hypothetical protein